MSVTTAGIRLTTTAGGEIRRIAPVTVTTATRFVNCSAGGQKRIGRAACGASPIAKVTPVGSKTRAVSKGHSREAVARNIYDRQFKSGRRDSTGGLSAQTVQHIHRLLSQILGSAVKSSKLRASPIAQVQTAPKVRRPDPDPRRCSTPSSVCAPQGAPSLHAGVACSIYWHETR